MMKSLMKALKPKLLKIPILKIKKPKSHNQLQKLKMSPQVMQKKIKLKQLKDNKKVKHKARKRRKIKRKRNE